MILESFSEKYRVKTYQDVYGQEITIESLKSISISKLVPSAVSFFGCYGSGKSSVAEVYAHSFFCTDLGENGSPCCKCANCKSQIYNISIGNTSGYNPQIVKYNCAQVKNLAKALIQWRRYGCYPFRVIILDEANQLGVKDQFAILNCLEESKSLKFILTASSKDGFHGPLLNRCQEHLFTVLSKESAKKMLIDILCKEGFNNHPIIIEVEKYLITCNNVNRALLGAAESIVRQLKMVGR
jgi:DNA polymerase-3 subunit gamma/tau